MAEAGPGGAPPAARRLEVRPFRDEDWPAVWGLLRPVFRAGETYAVDRDIGEAAGRGLWTGAGKWTFVALDPSSGEVLGTYYGKANHPGAGAHVANCGYVVGEAARGRGVASAMCRHSLAEARRRGHRAMQFNLVAASNQGAVRLWQRLGFAIVGTLPGAFAHPVHGDVDAHVMFQSLEGGGAASRAPEGAAATPAPAPAP